MPLNVMELEEPLSSGAKNMVVVLSKFEATILRLEYLNAEIPLAYRKSEQKEVSIDEKRRNQR